MYIRCRICNSEIEERIDAILFQVIPYGDGSGEYSYEICVKCYNKLLRTIENMRAEAHYE